ncbi:MAG: hypothetical protein ACR2QH_13360, partial [Geminicoccaceae bacterium]
PLNKSFRLPDAQDGFSLDSSASVAAIAAELDRQAQLIGYLNAFLLYTAAAVITIPFLFFVRIKKAS